MVVKALVGVSGHESCHQGLEALSCVCQHVRCEANGILCSGRVGKGRKDRKGFMLGRASWKSEHIFLIVFRFFSRKRFAFL